jgi:transcriptional regulator with XRE-family HTH domain
MRLRSRETLRALMRQEGHTLTTLATAAHVNRSFISHLTSGRSTGATPPVAHHIATALNVPTHVLFTDTTPQGNARKH